MDDPAPPFLPEARQSAFLAALAHELRSPLQGLVGWMTLLRYDGLDEADRRAAIEGIEQSVRSQSRLLDDLVELAELLSPGVTLELAAVELREITAAAVGGVARFAVERGVQFALVPGPETPVTADPRRLRSVVGHLVTHAARCAASGSRLALECRPECGSAVLTLRDPGAASAELAGSFDTVSPAVAGRRHPRLTLGLAIARHLAACQGGSLEAAADGQGSVLTLRMPAPLAGGPAASV